MTRTQIHEELGIKHTITITKAQASEMFPDSWLDIFAWCEQFGIVCLYNEKLMLCLLVAPAFEHKKASEWVWIEYQLEKRSKAYGKSVE